MIFAPVVIPTVSRFDHLKRCIESLEKCTWADKTNVYIALDYPGREEHWEGYRKIRKYLESRSKWSFHSFNVIYRDHNYFYSGEGNAQSLISELFTANDRYIYSEDDNIFSPNFLVFLNKGLSLFEDDYSVLAINGYRHYYPVVFDNNTFYRQNVDFSAWGYGTWKGRSELISSLTPQYFRQKMNWKSYWKVHKNGNNRLIRFLRECYYEETSITDNTLSVLMPLENMDVVMPRVSLVRNTGWDNTGVNCSNANSVLANSHLTQEISDQADFDYIGTGKEHYQENKRIYVRSSYGKTGAFPLAIETGKFLLKRMLYES